MQKNILNYTEKELEQELAMFGEPAYRAQQIFKGIYSSGWRQFSQFTTLTKNFRSQLDDIFNIENIKEITSIKSELDGTTKFLWELPDKNRIESVIIYEGKRVTFCISSQVGCALDCKFCATGKMGIIRNLTPGEIIEQVLRMKEKSNYPPTNIVYMGMGE
ncbi:MAG: 23S rRNA (adenine(2503)-C(2))-methyltransferase RlmN, partial [Calditrichota bacterium]